MKGACRIKGYSLDAFATLVAVPRILRMCQSKFAITSSTGNWSRLPSENGSYRPYNAYQIIPYMAQIPTDNAKYRFIEGATAAIGISSTRVMYKPGSANPTI